MLNMNAKGHKQSVTSSAPDFHLDDRACGVLLHPTSLPGPHGSGDLGAEALAFADFLADSGVGWWQMLPVNPPGEGNSPYSGASASAGNFMLIGLEELAADGLLDRSALRTASQGSLPLHRVDFARVQAHRRDALRRAFAEFRRGGGEATHELATFRRETNAWLDDYALYMALVKRHGGPWTEWPPSLRARDPVAMAGARRELADEVAYIEFEEFVFDKQWRRFRLECARRGVGLIGDAPIFVAHTSSDVWAHSEFFRVGPDGRATHVAGVPPDYFCRTGQRWGNPLYRWKRLKRAGYRWWIDRFAGLVRRFDVIRLDHFIGFARYWEMMHARRPPNAVAG